MYYDFTSEDRRIIRWALQKLNSDLDMKETKWFLSSYGVDRVKEKDMTNLSFKIVDVIKKIDDAY
jgi:hypothetical protein